MEHDLLDKILKKVLEMDEKINLLVTEEIFEERMDNTIATIDRFAKLHEIMDQELSMMRNRYDRLDERLSLLEERMVS